MIVSPDVEMCEREASLTGEAPGATAASIEALAEESSEASELNSDLDDHEFDEVSFRTRNNTQIKQKNAYSRSAD